MKVNGSERCIGCMKLLDQDGTCPYCGFSQEDYEPIPRCLRPGTYLKERYMLGRVLGEGSFGISYVAWDCLLDMTVAIKEYFPASLVSRHVGGMGDRNVYIYENAQKDKYQENLKKYLMEAKSLSAFSDMEGIVSVRDFFYENNTAYIVMGYVDGNSVKEYVEKNGPMDGEEYLQMLKPVIQSLKKVHQMGMLHRDISPDNLLITRDHKLVLIDFGAARKENINMTRSMTVVFKRGFSPEEQYRSRGKQGAWTDVYALCATSYYVLTGTAPDESIQRVLEDDMPSLTNMPDIKISMAQKKALMKGIAVNFQNRYQTMAELYQALYQEKTKSISRDISRRKLCIGAAGLAVCVGLTIGFMKGLPGAHHDLEKIVPSPAITAPVVAQVKVTPVRPAKYIMPQCVGKTKKQAKKLVNKKTDSLTIRWKYKYSSKVSKGRIVSQSIPAKKECEEGSHASVTCIVSKGIKKITVPKLTGKSRQDAIVRLRADQLRWKLIFVESTSKKGTVITQDISAGSRVRPKRRITLTISRGKKNVTVRTTPVPERSTSTRKSPTVSKTQRSSKKTDKSTEFEGVIP